MELSTNNEYCTWRIHENGGIWCAETGYGSSIWAKTYDELVKLFKDFGAEIQENLSV